MSTLVPKDVMSNQTPTTRTGGGDAVCFTAGPKGAIFSAGVIHAWLAADRKPPQAAAGISAGALTAAAMQYAYRALECGNQNSDIEVRRWMWFRKYLAVLSDSPLEFLWKAIPDPVDFFADRPPVKDLSRPDALKQSEAESRRHYYVLTRLGNWLGGLPVTVNRVAAAVISYVRGKERYGPWLLSWAWFGLQMAIVSLQLLGMLGLPPFVSERTFTVKKPEKSVRGLLRSGGLYVKRLIRNIWSWRFRPLFGWRVWFGSLGLALLLMYTLAGALAWAVRRLIPPLNWVTRMADRVWWQPVAAVTILGISVLLLLLSRKETRSSLTDWLASQLLGGLGLSSGFLHDYRLHATLLRLFADNPSEPKEPTLKSDPFHLILVATALQIVTWKGRRVKSQQVWAEIGTPLTTALRAALRIPGLYAPLRLSERRDIEHWVDADGLEYLDLVDGAGISQNPLSALCAWFGDHPEVGDRLSGTHPDDRRVHVVYNVPIEPYKPGGGRPDRINIVQSAFISRELERRRDTRQEFRQTNFMSELELYVRQGGGKTGVYPIFVDEIAPEHDITFKNNLDPKSSEVRLVAAAGCRNALETLYRDELRIFGRDPIQCHTLLRKIAPRRANHISAGCPGVQEICSQCTRELRFRQEGPALADGLIHSFGQKKTQRNLVAAFPHLTGEKPRIVFLGSGGVFRGSFHAGVVAAMHALKIKPDLVVGASVGALMGGALCAVSVLDDEPANQLLKELCNTFLCVDERVALTRTLKNTSKQLGVRGLRIRLSPRVLRRMIRRGGRSDPGFAAAGAPPALIDAMSDFFLMPHARTRSIASEFVAGHFSGAINRFWQQVQKETLPSLDIETFLMGTDMLEPLARKLLGGSFGIGLDTCQPYHQGEHRASFFCTTSDLFERRSLILGRDFFFEGDFLSCPGSYDFVSATLSSSAFPVVFRPRSEAQLLPGRGRMDVLLADGGMFDNLPFFPAIELLSAVQTEYRRTNRSGADANQNASNALQFLGERQQHPALIISAALDANADVLPPDGLRGLRSILRRVDSLQKNVKSKSFAETSERVGEQTEQLLKMSKLPIHEEFISFADSAVPAGVLQIIPTDTEHVNPTFAFCKSVGMERDRVQRSMADGCFQTMRSIVRVPETHKNGVLRTSVECLTGDRIPRLRRSLAQDRSPGLLDCVYYQLFDQLSDRWVAVKCPFAAAAAGDMAITGVRTVCAKDVSHRWLATNSA